MPDSAGYLPPVVARIVGDISDLVSKLEQAKALLRDFAKDAADVRLSADTKRLAEDLVKARMEITQVTDHTYSIRVGADITPALAQLAALQATVASTKSNIGVGARPAPGSLAAGALGSLFGVGRKDSGRLGSFASGALWGDTGGGFMSRLLSPLTMFTQMFSAGFGSLGSLAGFGPEHLAMTAGGLAGLGVEGGMGAGLLGLGSAGVSGAGMLADSAGTGQALGDIKNVLSAQQNLNKAIAEYGKDSTQAARAQNLVNFALAGFSPVARAAVAHAAAVATSFKAMYDKVTGQAEKIGAGIITQAVTVGKAFLPELGKAATANAGIIRRGLQPLFTWFKSSGGGLGIFKNLENIFTGRLPGAVKGFDAALELLLRTINLIAPQTGGLIKELSKLAEHANGSGWSAYAAHVEHLIADFRILEAFFKALGHDLAGVFKDDAGEPQAIVGMWTTSLQKLGKWIDSINGKKKITQIFDVHKSEILGILHAVGEMSTGFGKFYLQVAPAFVTAVNGILRVLNPLLRALNKTPFGPWIIGIGVIGARFGLFRGLLSGIGKQLGTVFLSGGKAIFTLAGRLAAAAVGMLGLSTATDAEAASSGIATIAAAALNAVLMVGILGAVVALAFGIYELVKHWKTVWNAIKSITSTVYHAVVGFFVRMWHDIEGGISTAIGWVRTHWKLLAEILVSIFLPGGIIIVAVVRFWPQIVRFFGNLYHGVVNWVKRIAHDVGTFFERMYTDVTKFASRIYHDVINFFKRMWHDVTTGVSTGVDKIVSFFKSLPGRIMGFLAELPGDLLHLGENMASSLIKGIGNLAGDVGHAISGGIKDVGGFLGKITHLAKGGVVTRPTLALVGEAGTEYVIPQAMLHSLSGATSPLNLSGAGMSGSNPQLDRIEKLLTSILGEAKTTTTNTKTAASNTQRVVDVARGLSSPAGVAAQIAQSHSKLVTSLRVGPAY